MADAAPKYDHAWDLENLDKAHTPVPGSTEGGACLNRHYQQKRSTGFYREHSCSHPWQAFQRALLHDSAIYNGNGKHRLEGDKRWYDEFLKGSSAEQKLTRLLRLAAKKGGKGGIQRKKLPRPERHGWDISTAGKNYQTGGNEPILHEAHHIVAADELRTAIKQKVDGMAMEVLHVQQIRKGLLDAKYNLNHKDNMIILPIEEQFARAMGLPRHRLTENTPNHRSYSDYIQTKLKAHLTPVQKNVQKCKEVKYTTVRDRILSVSKQVRAEIKAKGLRDRGKALDQVFAQSDGL